jgi:ribosomal protein L11 methyltransferase
VITIEPGRAFGTGHHGTTAGCLEALESMIDRDHPSRMLDVGTGSGILAIAAARLGVGAVLAVDDDPDAVACAMANAARNHVSDRVRCALADAATLRESPVSLLVANLLSAAHRRLGAQYLRSLTPGGTLLLGGILDGEAADVVAALADHGLLHCASRSVEGWTTLELRAPLHDPA